VTLSKIFLKSVTEPGGQQLLKLSSIDEIVWLSIKSNNYLISNIHN